MRRTLPLCLCLCLCLSARAEAVTRDQLTAFADKAAAVWSKRQASSGEFLDPHRDRPSSGYGNAMIGYALMRAGERRDDEALTRSGVRGVSAALDEPPLQRGVFDLLSVAAAYNFARQSLADDPSFSEARPRWEQYLRETGPPNVENAARACIEAADCFHNHEAVEATANLELLATEITSPALGDPAALRASIIDEVGVRIPGFATGSARAEGERDRKGLALLSDSGSWPLAYHALSTAMLARSIELLGDQTPPAATEALK